MAEQPSNRGLAVRLFVFAVGMFAFGFVVLPPLYEVFCEITGFGGRTNTTAVAAVEEPDLDRTIRIEFVTTVNQYAPWNFTADVPSMEVNPGRMYYATFTATNRTAKTLVSQSVPSVTPIVANTHFKKLECFCFESQAFAANETRTLPLSFIVDPDLPDYIDTITLSYTLFKTENNYVSDAR